MKTKPYLLLCLGISVIISLSILLVPGLAESIETWMLGFLARNAAL